MGTAQFSMRKRVIFGKIKEDKDLRGGALLYAAPGNPQSDTEIAKKRRFRTGTNELVRFGA